MSVASISKLHKVSEYENTLNPINILDQEVTLMNYFRNMKIPILWEPFVCYVWKYV